MSDFQKYLDDNLGKVYIADSNEEDELLESYDIYDEIRAAVISLREESHLTQKELAAKTGITQANISKIEKGISKPTLDSLKKIADATGTRLIVDFIGQEDYDGESE